jgi:hypothetical protein
VYLKPPTRYVDDEHEPLTIETHFTIELTERQANTVTDND